MVNNYKGTFIIAFLVLYISSCRPIEEEGYSLAVISGHPVTSPDQGPGTYVVEYQRRSSDGTFKTYGNASSVAVGTNTFLTNAHVLKGASQSDRVRIVDYKGNTVYAFDPRQNQVKAITNPNFDGFNNDTGAFVLPENLSSEKLTQGIVPIAMNSSQAGDKMRLVGAGYKDYRALHEPQKFYTDYGPNTLSYGENVLSDSNSKQHWVIGPAFYDQESKASVTGPGDSGGGLFSFDKNGNPQLAGLLTGGAQFDNMGSIRPGSPNNPSPTRKNFSNGNEENITPGQAISANANHAESYATNLSTQNGFIDNLASQGANISIPTFYNPNSLGKYSGEEMDGFNEMYGDAWKNSAVVRSADKSTYSGYQEGTYNRQADGRYQWFDNKGTATNNYASYNSEKSSWELSKTQQTPQSVPPSNSGPIIMNEPPPNTVGP